MNASACAPTKSSLLQRCEKRVSISTDMSDAVDWTKVSTETLQITKRNADACSRERRTRRSSYCGRFKRCAVRNALTILVRRTEIREVHEKVRVSTDVVRLHPPVGDERNETVHGVVL